MKVLSVGGAGFLGEIITRLNCNDITVLDKNQEALDKFCNKYPRINNAVCGDFLNESFDDNLRQIINKSNCIFYFAAVDHKPDQNAKQKNNKNLCLTDFQTEMNVGVFGAIKILEIIYQMAIEAKSPQEKRVILFGSDLGVIAPNQTVYEKAELNFRKPVNYSAVKFALIGVMKYYAAELAAYNVSVNMISPSGVLQKDNKLYRPMADLIPAGRNCTIEDLIAPCCFFLNSSHFITGQNLMVDGGRTLW